MQKLSDWRDETLADLEQLRSRAIRDGNLALEQRIDQIDLGLQNLVGLLGDEMDDQMATLSQEAQRYVERLVSAVEEATDRVDATVYQTELAVGLAIADFCSGLSILCRTQYSVHGIDNTVVVPPVTEKHSLFVSGTALRDDATLEVYVGDTRLPPEAIYSTAESAVMEVVVPASLLPIDERRLLRPKVRLVVTGPIDNPDRSWGQIWKPKIVNATRADITFPLYVLPARPLRVDFIERAEVDEYVACAACVETYTGYTVADRVTRVTEHVLPIADDFDLDRVLVSPERRRDPVGNDTYILYCSTPAVRVNGSGHKEIVSRCLDAAINRSCASIANRLYEAKDDAIIDYPYPCFALAVTRRHITFTVQLEQRRPVTTTFPLALDRQTPEPDGTYVLGFGEYLSRPLRSASSGVSARLILNLAGRDGQPIQVNLGAPSAAIPGVGRAELAVITNGPESIARLVLNAASLRELQR